MSDQFMGYRRPDGSVGVRNQLAIIPSVFCANHVAKMIAQQLPGTIPFLHQCGCGQHGKDLDQTYKTLIGIGKNPNFGAVLVVGLGCERIKANELAGYIAESGKPVEYFTIQDKGGTIKSIEY